MPLVDCIRLNPCVKTLRMGQKNFFFFVFAMVLAAHSGLKLLIQIHNLLLHRR
jgi:hypothetical protein